jgi:hypothetical protein
MRIDHVLHLLGCWLLVDLLALAIPLNTAMLLVLGIGIAKELVWDWWMDRGDPDATDLIAGGLGILFAHFWWSGHLLLALWALWVLYVFTMGLYRAYLLKKLKGLTLFMALPFVAVALVLDVLAQITVFTVLFAELPRHWLATSRLQRHIAGPDSWRRRLAEYLCTHLLDPFDPTGAHCDTHTSLKA